MNFLKILELLYLFLPLIVVVFSIIVGMFFEKVIFLKLTKIVKEKGLAGGEAIIKALKHIIILWFLLAGMYIAVLLIPVSPALMNILSRVFIVITFLSLTVVAARIAGGFINIYSLKVKDVLPRASLLENIARWTIYVVGTLIILQTLGISITPIITALGIGGLAVALALQDTLSNLFAGLHIIVSRHIRPGDYVKIENGEEGHVVDITWRNTTVQQLSGNIIIIPNSKLASSVVVNYNLPQKDLAVLVQVGVSYNDDLEKVERVTVEVAKEVMKEVPGGVPEFEPFIRYHTFSGYSINFTVILRAKEFTDQFLIKHEFIKRLHKRYKEEGITIPFPVQTVYLSKS